MPPILVAPPPDLVEKVYHILVSDPRLIATCCKICSWSTEKAERVARSYAQFIALKVLMEDFDDTKLVPSGLIEDMWCAHMLSTKLRYAKVCEMICGRLIHYDPCFKDDKVHYFGRMTKSIAKFRFGDDLDEEIWHYAFEDLDARAAEGAIKKVSEVSERLIEALGVIEIEDEEIEMIKDAKKVKPRPELTSATPLSKMRFSMETGPEIRDASETYDRNVAPVCHPPGLINLPMNRE